MSIKAFFSQLRFQRTFNKTAMLILAFGLASCNDEIIDRTIIYSNDFEGGSLEGIKGGEIFEYGSSNLLGNYNKGGFSLALSNLPDHDLLAISFDLFLHDSWDGNRESPDGPDIWGIAIGEGVFETTFSNSSCNGSYCLKQSYPNRFPFTNEPKKGAQRGFLPSLCVPSASRLRTSQYHIEKYFEHTDEQAVIEFYDRLVQSNTSDQSCDESWSLDNLTVTSISLN